MLSSGAAVSDRRARLPGSPKRKLREYASLHRKPIRIPSAHASGFKGTGKETIEQRRCSPLGSRLGLQGHGQGNHRATMMLSPRLTPRASRARARKPSSSDNSLSSRLGLQGHGQGNHRAAMIPSAHAPGGSPGTPGTKTTSPSMPDDDRRFPGSTPHRMARGKSCDPESPGFRRGLFVRFSRGEPRARQENAQQQKSHDAMFCQRTMPANVCRRKSSSNCRRSDACGP